jgi:aspartate-semialdehyde dehydrogenase
VGQRLVRSLVDHPWIELAAVGGSQRRAGTLFADALHPLAGGDLHSSALSPSLADLRVQSCSPDEGYDCDLVFSALPADVASEVEPAFARAGYAVVSNARSHRMEADVPLVIPEVNHEHIVLVPLAARFGLEAVQVTTMQALSGGGLGGPSALDMLDNVVPYIGGEEEKMESEPKKLLGTLGPDGIEPLDVKISAQCNRVGTLHGHLECVAVKLAGRASREDILAAWQEWHPLEDAGLALPSAPSRPVIYLEEPNRPQPRVDRDLENGMASITGRLRPDSILDYKFVTLGHNLARGAAGGTLLLAELLHASGLLD